VRGQARTRALVVVVAATVAATAAGTGAFGVLRSRATTQALGTAHFSSSPHKAQFGHLPASIHAHSITPCPGDKSVQVKLVQGGTTVKASASAAVDAKGKWSVFMSIPSNLQPGTYAVTAGCFASATPGPSDPVAVSYKPQSFKVVAPLCPGSGTTTTVACRTTTTAATTTSHT
jgi:hypothetical protein